MARVYHYPRRKMPDHPLAGPDGLVYIHRLVAYEKLGRLLRPDEQVHHLNGDTQDNRPENIIICSRQEHAHLHHGYAAMICAKCGTEGKTVGQELCRPCYKRQMERAMLPVVSTSEPTIYPVYSAAEAAKALGVTTHRVYQMVDEGKLQEARMYGAGGRRFIEVESVKKLKRERMLKATGADKEAGQ